MVCAPVRSIIPSLKLGDYLSVQAHKPCSISHLSFPYSKKVSIYYWVDRVSFPVVAWRSPASNSRPSGEFLHHNQAALTTRLRRLSRLVDVELPGLTNVRKTVSDDQYALCVCIPVISVQRKKKRETTTITWRCNAGKHEKNETKLQAIL